MSSSIVLTADHLGKCYRLYDRPKDRLKQFVVPRLQRLAGWPATKYYEEFWALRDVSMTVAEGETLGIIGRNGSGKSTLLQLLCGTLTPTTGCINANGRVAALLELGAGFHPEFTGRENVYINGTLLGLTRKEIDDRFDDIAAFAEIGELIDRPVKTYSSGMYVRLAFAVIAYVRADILIIDEALAVGDAFFVQKCMRFLRGFREHGTIVLVTHDTGAVVSLCTRAMWLDGGTLRMEGSPKDVCQAYLASQYGATPNRLSAPSDAPGVAASKTSARTIGHLADTSLRSDQSHALQPLKFDPDARSFGSGMASIVHASLLDKQGKPLTSVDGGEHVTICVRVKAIQPVASPIIGFAVQDRLGQILFGENTFAACRDHSLKASAGEEIESRFTFQMPILPAGEYAVAVAVADGTQVDHVQHHWIHDAFVIRSHASGVSTGLVGLPMLDISMRVLQVAA